jgi:hypothetical protein
MRKMPGMRGDEEEQPAQSSAGNDYQEAIQERFNR